MAYKIISLTASEEILNNLKQEPNQSELIRTLLEEHYRLKAFQGKTPEELEALKAAYLEKKAAEEKWEKLNRG